MTNMQNKKKKQMMENNLTSLLKIAQTYHNSTVVWIIWIFIYIQRKDINIGC